MTGTERVTAKEKERKRLADALRENLKRRKAQERERAGTAAAAEAAAEQQR